MIDFNQAKQPTQEHEHQHCEHCSIRTDIIFSFLTQLKNTFIEYDGDDLNERMIELAEAYYDDIYDEGRREAYGEILGYAGFSIDQIDEAKEEELE